MKPNFKNVTKESASMPKKYYDDLKKMGKTENLEYKEFKEQSLPKNTTTPTQTTGLPTWTNNYPCLLNSKLGKPVKTTSDNQVLISFSSGDKLYFWEKKCLYMSSKGEKFWGDWSCKSDKIYIKYDDGTVFDGDKVVKKPKIGGASGNSKYTKCPETLPIKQYCKNETIRKIQACLKMPKRFLTGNFGQNTQEYLESRGQNGILITKETIINVCGDNHPLVKDLGISVSGVENATGAGTTGAETTGAGTTGATPKPQSRQGSQITTNDRTTADYYSDYQTDEVESTSNKTSDSYSNDYSDYSSEEGEEPNTSNTANTPPYLTGQAPPTTNQELKLKSRNNSIFK